MLSRVNLTDHTTLHSLITNSSENLFAWITVWKYFCIALIGELMFFSFSVFVLEKYFLLFINCQRSFLDMYYLSRPSPDSYELAFDYP